MYDNLQFIDTKHCSILLAKKSNGIEQRHKNMGQGTSLHFLRYSFRFVLFSKPGVTSLKFQLTGKLRQSGRVMVVRYDG